MTSGKMSLVDVAVAEGVDRRDALTLSGAVEHASEHPIAQACFWAFANNVTLIPVAMLGFPNPLFAGAPMALSSVFLVSNSLRPRGFKAERDRVEPVRTLLGVQSRRPILPLFLGRP